MVDSYYFDDYILTMTKNSKVKFFRLLNYLQNQQKIVLYNYLSEFLLENCLSCKYYEVDEGQEKQVLDILNSYRNKINLLPLKNEIKYKFGKDAKIIYLFWSNSKGLSIENVASDLKEQGIFLDSINPKDMFFEFLQLYKSISKKHYETCNKLKYNMTKGQIEAYKKYIYEQINFFEKNKTQREM